MWTTLSSETTVPLKAHLQAASDELELTPDRLSLFSKARVLLGLDEATLFTIGARAWTAVAGMLTVLAIARFLTPESQGYYFTISSLLALQIVFELGFCTVILQLASHETAGSIVTRDGMSGTVTATSRLASILRSAACYYGVVSVLLAAILIPVGGHLFRSRSHSLSDSSWLYPWILAVVCTSVNLFFTPLLSFLEGCGFVSEAAKTRFWQSLLGTALAWVALGTGHGLYSPGLMIGGQAFCISLWFLRYRRLLSFIWRQYDAANVISWRREVWAFQWRMAVCWLCGYFAFQLFSPVLFYYQGPAAAGRMGLSLSVATALANTALAWINTKAAPFGALIAKRDFAELDRIYSRAFSQSTILICAGCSAACISLAVLSHINLSLSERFLSSPLFVLLMATTALNHVVFCQAAYLRAHKREAFLMLHVVSAIVVGCTTYYFGRTSGLGGVTAGYFLGRGVLCFVMGTRTFEDKRREWHALAA